MRARKRQKNLLKLGDFLPKTLKKKKMPLDIRDQKLCKIWSRAVGPLISAQTEPHRIQNKKLFVKVSTSAWMQQLQFMKEDIIEKVNSFLDEKTINKIHLSLGELPHISKSPHVNSAPDFEKFQHLLRDHDKKLITSSLKAVTDEELKEILHRVMKKEIIKRRLTETKKER